MSPSVRAVAFVSVYLIAVAVAQQRGGSRPANMVPPFLQSASSQVQDSFRQIMSNDNLTHSQKQAQLDTLIRSQSAQIQQAYAESQQAHQQMEQQMKAAKDTLFAKASAETRQLASQLDALFSNPNLTRAQAEQQKESLMASASSAVRSELENIHRQMFANMPNH